MGLYCLAQNVKAGVIGMQLVNEGKLVVLTAGELALHGGPCSAP